MSLPSPQQSQYTAHPLVATYHPDVCGSNRICVIPLLAGRLPNHALCGLPSIWRHKCTRPGLTGPCALCHRGDESEGSGAPRMVHLAMVTTTKVATTKSQWIASRLPFLAPAELELDECHYVTRPNTKPTATAAKRQPPATSVTATDQLRQQN